MNKTGKIPNLSATQRWYPAANLCSVTQWRHSIVCTGFEITASTFWN